MRFPRLAAALLCLLAATARAEDTPYTFDDPAKQQTYEQLINELRCLVCQNQTLADSHADLAQDLRREVYTMVTAGKNRAEVIDYLVKRYGDFVLYRPPMKDTTWLLWAGPVLLLAVAGGAWFAMSRSKQRALASTLTPEEQARLAALTGSDEVKRT